MSSFFTSYVRTFARNEGNILLLHRYIQLLVDTCCYGSSVRSVVTSQFLDCASKLEAVILSAEYVHKNMGGLAQLFKYAYALIHAALNIMQYFLLNFESSVPAEVGVIL